LPDGGDAEGNKVKISEINADINNSTLYFDATATSSNNIGYRALEAFKKSTARTYYDYGNYMRTDPETGETHAIPSYCIDEIVDSSTSILYGVYHKGAPGCEAPMVEEEKTDAAKAADDENNAEDTEETKESEKKTTVEKEDIYIRRTYNNRSDREEYINGNDNFPRTSDEKTEKKKGYYFDSQCLQYDDDDKGTFNEEATIEQCPLLSEELRIGDSSYGKNSDGEMGLSF
jgi:hypothetical protein